jgi:hypothetical protein
MAPTKMKDFFKIFLTAIWNSLLPAVAFVKRCMGAARVFGVAASSNLSSRIHQPRTARPAFCMAVLLAMLATGSQVFAQSPVISSITTPSGQTLSSAPSGSTIAINGSGFGKSPASSFVAFAGFWVAGSAQAGLGIAVVNTWSDTQIVLTIPPESVIPPGNYNVTVDLWDGVISHHTQNSNAVAFSIGFPQPVIYSLSAGAQSIGGFYQTSPSATITVYGANLGNGCINCGNGAGSATLAPTPAVQGGPSPVSIPYRIVKDNTEIAFTLPATIPPGNYDLVITNGAGKSSAGVLLIINAATASSQSPVPQILRQATNQQILPLDGSVFQAQFSSDSCGSDICGTNWDSVRPPVASSTIISETLTPLVPIRVDSNDCNDPISVTVQIWTDASPVQPDPNASQDGSPDGNGGSWKPAGSANIPPTNTVTTTTTYHAGHRTTCSWGTSMNLPVTLSNPFAPNFLIFQATQGTGNNLNFAQPDVPFPLSLTIPGNYTTWLTVQPVPLATVNLGAFPIAIIYQPPGDMSEAYLDQSVANTIQYSAGSGTQISNSSTNSTSLCDAYKVIFDFQHCQTQSITTGSGVAQTFGQSTLEGTTAGNSWDAGTVNALIPFGNVQQGETPGQWGGNYWNEPFWWDQFVFQLNGTYAMFDNGGVPVFVLLPGQSFAPSNPIPLAMLAACVAGLASPNTPDMPQNTQPCDIGPVTLSQQQAWSAILLDPFFLGGQSVDPSQICTYTTSGKQCRAQSASNIGSSYQENVHRVSATGSTTNASSTYVNTANSYWTSVTSSTLTTAGIDLKGSASIAGMGSISSEMSSLLTFTNSTTTGTTITYQASTLASSTQTTSWGVTLADWDNVYYTFGQKGNKEGPCSTCHPPLTPKAAAPFVVDIYQDNVFSGLMFRDPNAPGLPGPYVLPATPNSPPTPAPEFIQQMKNHLPSILSAAITIRKLCTPWPSCILSHQGGGSGVHTAPCNSKGSIPVVTAVTPNSGPAQGGFSVLIRGHGFCGATAVTAGGWKSKSFTLLSDDEIRAILPGLPATARIPDNGYVVDVSVCNRLGCSPQYIPGNFKYTQRSLHVPMLPLKRFPVLDTPDHPAPAPR